jgi:ABC-type dipeptide/oligopeptide/nickel transport system permease subunit
VGLVTVAWGVAAGVALGLWAGVRGGLVEAAIMRATDLLLAFPYFLLTIVLVAVLGPSLVNAMIAIAVWTTPHYVRLVRAVVLSVKGREFVEAARALGRGEAGIAVRHVLPACVPTVVVQSAVFCAQNMLMAASLSFLGLGAQPPSPELGAMLGAGRAYLRVAPQVVAVPAAGILLGVFAFNFLGDALRDRLDPGAGRVA